MKDSDFLKSTKLEAKAGPEGKPAILTDEVADEALKDAHIGFRSRKSSLIRVTMYAETLKGEVVPISYTGYYRGKRKGVISIILKSGLNAGEPMEIDIGYDKTTASYSHFYATKVEIIQK